MRKMLSKKEVLKSLKDLPDEFPVDEAIERLIVLQKINQGKAEIQQGKGLTTAQAKKKLKKWLS
ncbi:hypothetical protein [Terrimonas pollutisoli]|uniref:hypothetical protein n=1 Tax=Terrimonas pollutisoli TaxID=3034147 RepID=UPI0023EB8E51|nr:hypothetical protein [Terrimonas sp. H1YJ31]